MTPREHTDTTEARVDLHCHSSASQLAKLGIQRSAGLPECATPPEEVYELAKERGMDYVTITDHDTIDGVLEIADRPDVFISEELTAWFRGEEQGVHVLCWGIQPIDHEWLQAHSRDLEACADYLHANNIACALAHPFYAVAAPLTPRHRRRLARLFETWETRNGSRAPELNMPAAVYIETYGGTGVGGSDDHAGVDIGRTWTRTPAASTPEELLAHIRSGRAEAGGEQGSAAKWAHSALALATRSLLGGDGSPGDVASELPAPSPDAVLRLSERVVSQGRDRGGEDGADFSANDARALLGAWLAALGFRSKEELLATMKDERFSHGELRRRARAVHEGRLGEAVRELVGTVGGEGDASTALGTLFAALVPVVPYVPATSFLAGEKERLAGRSGPGRVALVVDAIGSMHGVSHTIERLRQHGVPGYEVDVIGTDPGVDRRLPTVSEVEVPFYSGLEVGVPSVPGLVEVLTDGRYDLVHVASPGPAGVGAALVARISGLPIVASHHTELVAYAAMRSGRPEIETAMRAAIAALYAASAAVLSPSTAADESVRGLGVPDERIGRWARGVDLERFDPGLRRRSRQPGAIRVLYAGRQSTEKGVDLLAESFELAHEQDPRLHLLLAGGGPEEGELRARLGERATWLGWLEGGELARAYASADVFLFCSRTDTYGQVVVEAQASGLPVVAVDAGGPRDLIEDGVSGLLRPADPRAIAAALVELAGSRNLRRALAAAGRSAAEGRSWPRAMAQLADGYSVALGRRIEPAPAPPAADPTPLVEAA